MTAVGPNKGYTNMSADWLRRRVLDADYEITTQRKEIERLRAALTDARQALTNITTYDDIALAKAAARIALGITVIEQSAPKTLAEKVKEASRRPVSDRDG